MKKHFFQTISFCVLSYLSVSCDGTKEEHVKTYKFAVICDTRSDADSNGVSGVNVAGVSAVCAQLVADSAEFVLAPGDFICGQVNWYKPGPPTSDLQFQAFLNAAKDQGVGLTETDKVRLFPVRGNHECYHDSTSNDSVKAAWIRNIGRYLPQNGPEDERGYTFSFIRHGMLFIGLDQYMHATTNQKDSIGLNQAYLDTVLSNHQDINTVFTFGHTPAFSANHPDCLGSDSLARNAFLLSIKDKSGVYFCGHDHFYARAEIPIYKDSVSVETYIQQIITPSGAPFLTGSRKDNPKWTGKYANKDVHAEKYLDDVVGYQLVTISGNNVTVEFKATLDASTYTVDSAGVYHYTYNDNWKSWEFKTMDSVTFSLH